MNTVGHAFNDIVQQQQNNQRNFTTCANNVNAMNRIIDSGGENISVEQRDQLSKLAGQHVTTKDPNTIVKLATQVRSEQVNQQKDIMKNATSKHQEYSELMGSLKTMIDTLKDSLGSLNINANNEIVNNVSNTISNVLSEMNTTTANNQNSYGMSDQELSLERYQNQMADRFRAGQHCKRRIEPYVGQF